jgi:hypothetical protein
MPKPLRSLIFLLPLLFLTACSFSLAEDITPPPGSVQQVTPQTQVVNTPVSPTPSETQGAYPAPVEGQAAEAYPAPAEAATPAEASIGTVNVQLVNGSGEEVPSDTEVILYWVDDMTEVFSRTLTTGVDGVYEFTGIEMPAGRFFQAEAVYEGGTYTSEIASADPSVTEIDMQVTVYDTTTDTSSLTIDSAHILFDFTDPSNVQVIEVLIISNPTNQSVVAAEEGSPVMEFSLPAGVTNLQFQDGALGGRYLETPGGFADTATISPGSSQEVFAFQMPYKNKLEFAQPVNMSTSAVIVMLPDVGIKLKSDQFQDNGVTDMQGTTYRLYAGSNLNRGDQFMFTLSGTPKSGGTSLPKVGSMQSLAIGVGVFGLALILAGVWLYRRSKADQAFEGEAMGVEEAGAAAGPAETLNDPDTLMDAIIALDDLYQAGKLPEEAYMQRRAELKARLKEKLDQ